MTLSDQAPAMTIGGERAPAERTFPVVNPATGEPFADAPSCTEAQLDAAMGAARDAFDGWRRDPDARAEALRRSADALDEQAEALAPLLVAEQGKPLAAATGEVHGTAAWLRYFSGLRAPVEVIADDENVHVEVRRQPIGPVAAITPWNFPLMLAAWKLGPALAAGNTVVLKPSPYTPLTTLRMGEVLAGTLPAGVLNVITGEDPLGAAMVSHPVPRKVTLTGSQATGKLVAAAAAPDLKRLTLELGGNDVAVVLDDADPATIAEKLFWSAFDNCGQVCAAVKRVYADERIAGELTEALAELAGRVVVGDGMEAGTEIGPLNNAAQHERVGVLVKDAVRRGGRIAAGGGPLDRPGYFYAPTVVADADDGMRLVDEEQFGPALPVVAVRDAKDALRRANASMYALGGSVWSADPERATAVADELECGTVWINTHNTVSPAQPFGGLKWSGIGVEHGTWGLLAFTEIRTVHVAKR